MKKTLIVVALCSLFSCGADVSYSGRLHEAVVAGEASSRSSRSAGVSFDSVQQTLHIEGLEAALATVKENEGGAFNFAQQGDVLGGLGTVTPTRLSFSISLVRRTWPYGFSTITFDGVRSEQASEEEPPTFVPMFTEAPATR